MRLIVKINKRRLLAEIDKWPEQRITIGEIHKRLTEGQLAPGAFERAGLFRDFKDLLRREQEMKERFTHDIMKLESKRRKP